MSTERPLVVTTDPDLLEDLLRLAATAGVELEVSRDLFGARVAWATAPLVVLGHDAAGSARGRLPRRPGVVLVGCDLDDAGVWQLAVEVGAERVLFLPDAEPWLVGALADAAEVADEDGAVVAVVGGRGGAGATTLASALAVSAERSGRRALLVDGDPLGGGIDLVFGGERSTGLRWADLRESSGRLPAGALADALPRLHDLSVLSWGRDDALQVPAAAVGAVLEAARRSCELVVVDVPRSFDDAAREALAAATTTLLVVPAEVRAAAAAARVATVAGALCRDLRVVVRTPGPAGLTARQICGALGLPMAGELRPEPGLDASLERGEPPGQRSRSPLGVLCDGLLAGLVGSRRAA